MFVLKITNIFTNTSYIYPRIITTIEEAEKEKSIREAPLKHGASICGGRHCRVEILPLK